MANQLDCVQKAVANPNQTSKVPESGCVLIVVAVISQENLEEARQLAYDDKMGVLALAFSLGFVESPHRRLQTSLGAEEAHQSENKCAFAGIEAHVYLGVAQDY